ncbi:fimbrial protein [Pseudomonas chlororaphis]|uniref:fimbrial protein n=1 Tax=Pseudomonas chlororaphis TaxID=587753 RepID=UPI001926925B|nr:fimbrial protein [Pseudomonas chlororaphis]QQX60948.1 type 1 fimbrial protein [Pseudomonas chlororaphis subsp. aurantiaca]
MTLNNNLNLQESQNSSRPFKTGHSDWLNRLLQALIIQSVSFNAMAACSLVTGSSAVTLTVSVPSTLPFPRDTPDNTVLYESAPVTATGPSFMCTTDTRWGVKNKLGTDSPTSKIFPIGDTGISWQWIYNGNPTSGDGGGSVLNGGQSYGFNNTTHALRLLKTGTVKSNTTIPIGEIGNFKVGTIYPITLEIDKELKFIAQSCETPDVRVEMGQYDLGIFSEIGDTSKATSFNILLNNCPSGIKKVMYTLAPNPTAPAWNTDLGIIELNGSSTAQGIALQILDSNQTPLELNKDHVFSDYTSTGGDFRIPLSARYYRTLPASSGGKNDLGVRPGTANSEVSFVMSYL